jgi:hypothetical protein
MKYNYCPVGNYRLEVTTNKNISRIKIRVPKANHSKNSLSQFYVGNTGHGYVTIYTKKNFISQGFV